MSQTSRTAAAAALVFLLSAVRLLEAQIAVTEKPVLTLKALNHNRSVCFSADGKLLLTVRENWGDKKCCIFSMPEGRPVREFGDTQSNIVSASFSPDARLVVYGDEDHRVRVADASSGATVSEVDVHDVVRATAWSPDGKSILVGGDSKKLTVLDCANYGPRFEAQPHHERITGVAISPDGYFAAACSEDKTIKVIDLQRCAPVITLERLEDESKIKCVAFSGDGRFMCSGEENSLFRLWKVPEFTPFGRFPKANEGEIKAVGMSPDSRIAASGDGDGKIIIWDIEGMRIMHKRKAESEVMSLAFSPDGKFLAVGTKDHGVQIFGLAGIGPAIAMLSRLGPSVMVHGSGTAGHDGAGKRESLAVVDFDLRGKLTTSEPDAGRTIASLIVSRLDPARYEIYERGQLLQLLQEQKLQMTEIADNTDKAIKFGKVKGIRFIVLGSVDQLGEMYFITARLVDCETGRVGLKADAMANNLNLLGPAIDQLLAKMGLGA